MSGYNMPPGCTHEPDFYDDDAARQSAKDSAYFLGLAHGERGLKADGERVSREFREEYFCGHRDGLRRRRERGAA